MLTRNVNGQKFESKECKKNGWIRKNVYSKSKFKLNDAIEVKFNPKNLNDYVLPRIPFIVKHDAIDGEGIPIEIKKKFIFDENGNNLSILFSEYVSIKNYRDVYKLICEKLKIPYVFYDWNEKKQQYNKRKRIIFDKLYSKHSEIIPLEQLLNLNRKQKKEYYNNLMNFCLESGVTNMFNKFIMSDAVQNIFNGWIKNFKRKNFFLYCLNGAYHSSDLSFYVMPIKSYWGFNRMSVFVRLKKNV